VPNFLGHPVVCGIFFETHFGVLSVSDIIIPTVSRVSYIHLFTKVMFTILMMDLVVTVLVLAVLVCGHFTFPVWPFWSDLWPFWLWPFWFVAVLDVIRWVWHMRCSSI